MKPSEIEDSIDQLTARRDEEATKTRDFLIEFHAAIEHYGKQWPDGLMAAFASRSVGLLTYAQLEEESAAIEQLTIHRKNLELDN
jgi:hypothetical protein